MSNRILINVYLEDRITGTKDLKYSYVIVTPLTASEVVDSFNVNEGFYVQVTDGLVLSFVDFSCIILSPEEIIEKIKRLPSTSKEPIIELPKKCILQIERESNEELLTRSGQELVYTYSRFECGASGFGELLIIISQWVTKHPIAMVFIGGWIWDKTKDLWNYLRGKRKRGIFENEKNVPISFSPRKFHKKLAKMMNLDMFAFQITNISPVHRGKHKITVRTIKNEHYQVLAKASGDIISIEEQR